MSIFQRTIENSINTISSIKRVQNEIRAIIPPQQLIAHPNLVKLALTKCFDKSDLKALEDKEGYNPSVREISKGEAPNKLFLVDRDAAKIKELKIIRGSVKEVCCLNNQNSYLVFAPRLVSCQVDCCN